MTSHTSSGLDPTRAAALRSLRRKRGFRVHLTVYILVNGLLWVVWALTPSVSASRLPWPVFPMLGWGIGVACHGYGIHRFQEFTEEQIDREARRLRR